MIERDIFKTIFQIIIINPLFSLHFLKQINDDHIFRSYYQNLQKRGEI